MALGVVAIVLVMSGLGGLEHGAAAQPDTCPTRGDEVVDVALDAPDEGAEVEGVVEVSGVASSPQGVFQIELFVGDARRDVVTFAQPQDETAFSLSWDTAGFPAGPASVVVLACAGDPGAGSLVRGRAEVPVTVREPPSPADTRTLTVEGTGAGGGSGDDAVLAAGAALAVPAVVAFVLAAGRRRR